MYFAPSPSKIMKKIVIEQMSKKLIIYGIPSKNSAKIYHFKNLAQLKLIPHKK